MSVLQSLGSLISDFPGWKKKQTRMNLPSLQQDTNLGIYLLPILYNINIIWPTHTHALDSNVWSKQTLSSTDRGLQSKTNMHTYIHGEYVIQYLRIRIHTCTFAYALTCIYTMVRLHPVLPLELKMRTHMPYTYVHFSLKFWTYFIADGDHTEKFGRFEHFLRTKKRLFGRYNGSLQIISI